MGVDKEPWQEGAVSMVGTGGKGENQAQRFGADAQWMLEEGL